MDGQKIGRYGTLKLSSVTETQHGAKVAEVTLTDAKGVWFVIKGLDFAWNPRDLLARRLHIKSVSAAQTSVFRLPILTPPGRPRRLPIDVRIDNFGTNLQLARGVFPSSTEISHQTFGRITLGRDSSFGVRFDSKSLSGPADLLKAEIANPTSGPLYINISASGGPTGIVNTLFGAPDARNTTLTVNIFGDAKTGTASGSLKSGVETGGVLDAKWTPQNGRLDGFVAPHPQSWLGLNIVRLGGRIDVSASAETAIQNRRNVEATVTAPAIKAQFQGPVDFETQAVLKGSVLTLLRGDLATLTSETAAGLASGVLDVEGRRENGTLTGSLKGQTMITGLNGFGLAFNRVTSPLEITASQARLKVLANLEGQLGRANDPRLATFGTNPKLALEIEQDRGAALWLLKKAQLTGRGLKAGFTGRLSAQERQLAGRADIDNVGALVPIVAGPAQIVINLRQTTGATWQGKATVRSQNLTSSQQAITQLLGKQLEAEIVPAKSVAGDRRAADRFEWQVNSSNTTARGTLNLGDNVPLRGAWQLKTPFVVSRVSVAGVNRSGPAGDLAFGPAGFAVGSSNARIVIGGWNLESAQFLAVGGIGGKPITASISGIAPLGPASVSGVIQPKDGVVSLTNISVRHAGLQAIGTGKSSGGNFDGVFDLKIEPGAVLVSGTSSGRLGVAVRKGQVGLAADLVLNQAAFANAPIQVPTGHLRATGLLGALSLAFDGDVRSGSQQGSLNLTGSADMDGRETSLILNGNGDFGGRRFILSQPLRVVPLGTSARLTGQARWGDYRLGVDGQIRDGGLDVRFAEILGPAVSARLAGRLGGDDFTLRGTARFTNLTAFNSRLRGSANGDLTIRGSGGQNWSAQIVGGANNLSVGNGDADTLLGPRPRFELVARASRGQEISGSWKLIGKQLTGAGIVSPPRNGQMSNASGTWVINGPVKLGGADIVGRVFGTVSLQDAALAITATSPSLVAAGQAWRDLRASATIANILDMRDIPIEVKADGNLGPLKLNTNFRQGAPASLQPFVVSYSGIEGRGGILLGSDGPSGTLALQGSLGAIMASGSAQGTLAFSPSNLGTQINARLGLSNVTFQNAGVTGLTGTIAASGPLKDLTASLDTNFVLRGQAASARLTGRYSQAGDGSLLVINGGGLYQGTAWRLAQPLSATLQNKTMRASGRLVWREADLDFDAMLAQNGLNLNATLKDAPAALFSSEQARLDGRVSGTLALRGQGQNVVGEGRLIASGLKPRAALSSEAINGTIVAELRGGAVTFRGTATNARGLRAAGDARVPVVASLSPFQLQIVRTAALSGQFEIDGPVEAIAKLALSRNSAASGTVAARGQLSGTVVAPQIQGRVQVLNAALTDASLGVRVTDANAVVNFLGPVADIESLTASDGRGGKLQLGGRIAFRQGADWRLSGQMERFQLIGSNQALIVATGPWSLSSDGRQTILGGDLVLDNARIGIPAGTNRADALVVREINRPVALGPITPQSVTSVGSSERASTADLGLNLRLTSRGNTRVVSRGFDGNFDLGISVKGSLKAPQVDGRADLVRGRFDLAGRSFDMTKGSVAFLTPLTASRIEFIAERETADITALAKIRGTLGRPVFSLESTPPSPQDEILSRILFGRNVAALSLPQAAQLALGISSLATGNQLDPTARLGQALGLERFSLGTESGGFAGFTAGLRLVRDVYVEVTTGGEDGTVTMLEWRPRRRVQVQVTTSQKRESSVSVRLRSKD